MEPSQTVAAGPPRLAHHFDNIDQQREAETFGMWAFLCTEILIFGAMFAGYGAYRCLSSDYDHAFEVASGRLNVLIGAINTVVLLTSSLTMALAVYATHTGQRSLQVRWLLLTAALGAAFMVLKAIEYYSDYRDWLVPVMRFNPNDARWLNAGADPQRVQLFLMFYYIMTGLHAVHLTVGIGLVLWLAHRAHRGAYDPEHYIPVEVTGLYWHFVDVVWIFLLPILYLAGTHHLRDLHF